MVCARIYLSVSTFCSCCHCCYQIEKYSTRSIQGYKKGQYSYLLSIYCWIFYVFLLENSLGFGIQYSFINHPLCWSYAYGLSLSDYFVCAKNMACSPKENHTPYMTAGTQEINLYLYSLKLIRGIFVEPRVYDCI